MRPLFLNIYILITWDEHKAVPGDRMQNDLKHSMLRCDWQQRNNVEPKLFTETKTVVHTIPKTTIVLYELPPMFILYARHLVGYVPTRRCIGDIWHRESTDFRTTL
jgi:hypothetical protein